MKNLLSYLPDSNPNSPFSQSMADTVARWCALRTATFDRVGLIEFSQDLENSFAALGANFERHELSPLPWINDQGQSVTKDLGPLLRWRKRPNAPLQALLCIHTDVVYGESPEEKKERSQGAIRREGDWLHAAGSADAKGGIAILLQALLCLEASPWKEQLGFEVLLNPDEEIGSPGSRSFLQAAAARNHFGLLFEPCLPDGSLVGERKGSGNYTLTMQGKGAHAGRDFDKGKNAVLALAEVITELARLSRPEQGLTVNVGRMVGGDAVNRVPDFALARVNIRVTYENQERTISQSMQQLKSHWNAQEGYRLEIEGGISSPPKPLIGATAEMVDHALQCGAALGLNLGVKSSGGVCDGNKLAAFGLPNIDTLGALGDGLHGAGERLYLPSLVERTRLTALMLLSAASGQWKVPVKEKDK